MEGDVAVVGVMVGYAEGLFSKDGHLSCCHLMKGDNVRGSLDCGNGAAMESREPGLEELDLRCGCGEELAQPD
jgi:hypothetical protein